jgi:hypothetical protein
MPLTYLADKSKVVKTAHGSSIGTLLLTDKPT